MKPPIEIPVFLTMTEDDLAGPTKLRKLPPAPKDYAARLASTVDTLAEVNQRLQLLARQQRELEKQRSRIWEERARLRRALERDTTNRRK